MQFHTLLISTFVSLVALVAAQELPYQNVCGGEAQSGAVDCGGGFCCRKNAQCVLGGSFVSCSDGTVAFPYRFSLAVSLADTLETASPAAYTSILAQITGNPIIPATLLEQITGTPAPAATESEGAASALVHRAPGTGVWNILAVLGVWTVAVAGGAVWIFAH